MRAHAVATGLLLLAGAAPAKNVGPNTPNNMALHVVDVGQGSANILEFSCGIVMIDAGGQGSEDATKLVALLNNVFQRRTDLNRTIASVIVTHNHVDHTRSLDEVVANFKVKYIVENGMHGGPKDSGEQAYRNIAKLPASQRPAHVEIHENDLQPGEALETTEIDPVDCAGTNPSVAALWTRLDKNPDRSKADYDDKNNASLVTRVKFGKASFLFTGDLELPAINKMLECHTGSGVRDVDVYQVDHHGSHNATNTGLIAAMVKPKIALITSGPCGRTDGASGWGHGHPRAVTVQLLATNMTRTRSPSKKVWVADGQEDFRQITMKKAIYATGWDGNLLVEATKAEEYKVGVEKGGPQSCG